MMRSYSKKSIAAAVGFVFIAGFFIHWVVRFMQAEHALYPWDFIGFWQTGDDLMHRPHHRFLAAIATFGRSFHGIYNDLLALPSALMMALWGSSRFCYIISNALFLILPVAFIGLWLFSGLARVTWAQTVYLLVAFLTLLAIPLPWVVTISGMTDVGGLIMAAITSDLLIRTDFRSRSPIRWLAIGAAMALTALSKRWFIYLVIGWLAVLAVEGAVQLVKMIRRSRSVTLSSIAELAYGPFLCACGLVAVYMLSFPLPLQFLTTNYSDIYEAYQTGGSFLQALGINLGLITGAYGLVQVILSFFCFVAALFSIRTRRAAFYLFIPGWVAGLDFSRVQTMSDHHMLLLYIALVIPPLFLARYFFSSDLSQGKTWGWTLLVTACVVSCLNFQSVFAASPPFGSSLAQNLFSTERVQPIQRHDLPEITALMRFIEERSGGASNQPPVKDVYLLSSSLFLNSSILSTAGFQLKEPLPASDRISQTHDVDRRDGFPDELVTARIVLVADPIQTHLQKEQKVLTVPAQMFLEDRGFARAFTRDPQIFHLDHDVRVYTFERVRPSTPEEIKQLHDEIGMPLEK